MGKCKENPYNNPELISLLNAVFNVDDYGIVVVNAKGVISFVNKAYADYFGKLPEEMIGKYVNDAYINSAPSRLPEVLATGRPVIGDTYYLNGRYVVTNRFPIYENGKIIGAVGKVIFKDLEEFNSIYAKVNKGASSVKTGSSLHPKIKYDINNIIGQSPQMIDLKESIYKIATRNSTVLIRGESGTGKELFAQSIHAASYRRNNPLIKVNCAAIPENLLESELFGYADGAFTGARKGGHKGKFELANKGTIFLDEIGDMSLTMQAKLLRVLQEKEIQPLGGSRTKTVDVRIIAATNVNLEELIKYGKFRADLYYRLNVVSLNIPSLRERKEDIGLLVEAFVRKFNESFNLNVERVAPEVLALFQRYSWPGNIRELENIMEQAFNFVEGSVISLQHIPRYLINHLEQDEECAFAEKMSVPGEMETSPNKDNKDVVKMICAKRSLVEIVDYAEKEMIMKALNESNGNKAKAANMLGISRPALYKKLAKYKISS